MIFDIDDSLVERAFDGSHVDCLLERCLVRCDDDHRMSPPIPIGPTSNSVHTDRKNVHRHLIASASPSEITLCEQLRATVF